MFTQISLLIFLFFTCSPLHKVFSQGQINYREEAEQLWEKIEDYLDQQDADLLNYSILEEVRAKCGNKFDCLYDSYDFILSQLENRNEYWLAIPTAEEMMRLAQKEGNLAAESRALKRLIDLQLFIGEGPEATMRLSDLLALYEKMGDQAKVIETKEFILEGRIWELGEIAEVLPMIEGLRDQAIEQNLTETANRLLIRLKYIYEEFGYFEKFEKAIETFEQIIQADTIGEANVNYAFHAASGRADLLLKEQKYDQAKSYYEKALATSRLRYRAHHDAWSEIYVLLRLARLELDRNNSVAAEAYLDTAYIKSEEYKMPERKAQVLALQIQIAEADHRYEEALRLTREMHANYAKIDSADAGFDLKKHHLQLETKQLMAEKEKQTLALQLKNSQLRYSFIIAILFSLLAVGFLIGLWKQRQGKRELAVQNQFIQQQAEQLKNLDAAKSRFFANVSHELRTPLTLMLGPVHKLLKDQELSDQQKHLLQMTKRNGRQLRQLINEILDLRKLELGKMELDLQPTDLNNFFQQHFAQFESLAENNKIDFSYPILVQKNTIATIDREKCRQLVSNLLSNAFKFTTEGGQIKAEVQLSGENLELRVTDSGTGIHPEDLPNLFDRYFQTNRPEKPAQGGTGIGLALCKEYAELFGGKIEVKSTLGEGSVFIMNFPVKLLASQKATSKEEHQINDDGPQITSGNLAQPVLMRAHEKPANVTGNGAKLRPTILVVEDNPDLQDYIRLILSEKYEVVTADNGQQALELIAQHPTSNIQHPISNIQHPTSNSALAGQAFHLILSDLMMPVMDGFQLLENLKSNNATSHIPVVMLTARADIQDKLKALRIGVDDYLLKPFNEEELLVRIRNLLNNQSARMEVSGLENASEAEMLFLSEEDREWLESFETCVKNNLSNSILDVPFLAQEFAMSKSTLLRQLKRLTGLTPNQYINEVRLNEGRRLLESVSQHSVSEVSEKVGYGDPRSFSRSFKKRFGKLPSEVEQ